MRYKNRSKSPYCVKFGSCGRDPEIKCLDCISYRHDKLDFFQRYY